MTAAERGSALRAGGVPPVEEVASGIWWIPVALGGPLGYANVYALVTAEGVLLVDAGTRGDSAWETLAAGFSIAGISIADVVGIVVTHGHDDHYGLAHPVRDVSGCWVALPQVDEPFLRRFIDSEPDGDVVRDWCLLWGAPDRATASIGRAMRKFTSLPLVVPDRLLVEGDRIETGGLELQVIATPGHSPGHVSLVDHAGQMLFVGDTLLAGATPLVAVAPGTTADPISDYLATLARIGNYRGFRALGGHGLGPFDAAERADQLRALHEQLLGATPVLDHATVWEVASAMPSERPLDSLGGIGMWVALGEAHARLAALEGRGVLGVVDGVPLRWSPR